MSLHAQHGALSHGIIGVAGACERKCVVLLLVRQGQKTMPFAAAAGYVEHALS